MFIEVGPGNVLTRLVRRIDYNVNSISLSDDYEGLLGDRFHLVEAAALMTRRVVVTGVGAVTAVGHTAEDTWQAMLDGRSGIGPITLFDPEPYPVRIQAEVKELRTRRPRRRQAAALHEPRRRPSACRAALEALADSGFKITEENADMVGVIFSSGGGGTDMIIEHQRILDEKGPRRITPFLVANFIPDAASGHIAICTGARGPNMAVVSACATGAARIGEAFETIRRGDADAVIAGSSEAVLLPLYHATWCSMRALAGDNEHPDEGAQAVRPQPRRLHRRRRRRRDDPRRVRPGEGARREDLLRSHRLRHLERRLRHDRARTRPAAA